MTGSPELSPARLGAAARPPPVVDSTIVQGGGQSGGESSAYFSGSESKARLQDAAQNPPGWPSHSLTCRAVGRSPVIPQTGSSASRRSRVTAASDADGC